MQEQSADLESKNKINIEKIKKLTMDLEEKCQFER